MLEGLSADRLVLLGNQLRSESALTQLLTLLVPRHLLRLLNLQLVLLVQEFVALLGVTVPSVLYDFLAVFVDRGLEAAVFHFDCFLGLLV